MPAVVDFSSSSQFYLADQSIEQIVRNEAIKMEIYNRIAPVNSIHNFQKFDFKSVFTFVNRFCNELLDKQDVFMEIIPFDIIKNFTIASGELFALSPDSLSVQLTNSKSIFLVCTKDNLKIYLELFFDENTGKFSEAVLNIYENKAQQLAISGTLPELLDEICNYYQPSHAYLTYIQPAYAISGSATPAYAF